MGMLNSASTIRSLEDPNLRGLEDHKKAHPHCYAQFITSYPQSLHHGFYHIIAKLNVIVEQV
jgi:hypothetical protein